MILTFDTNGNEKQKEVARLWVDSITNAIAYGGSKMSGKTYLGCSLIFGDAFIYPGTSYFIARKNLNDLRKFTIPSIHEVFSHWGVTEEYYKYNGQDNYFELYNGSRVYLLDAKYLPTDPLYMRFGSMQFTRGWIEEGGEFSLDAKNNLQASIGRWKNDTYELHPKLLITCNPAHNFLYSDFYKKHKEGKLEPYNAFIQALPKDNKSMTKAYYENLERSLTPAQKRRLLYGEWEFDDDPSWLVDYDAICDMFTAEYVLPTNQHYLSTDLAMKGRDKFIGFSWQGLVGTLAYNMSYSEGPDIENTIKSTLIKNGIARSRTVADSDGLGAFLEGYVKGIVEFHNGGRAINPAKYANLKTECAYKLADLINARQIRIICSEEDAELIKTELTMLRVENIDVDTSPRRLIQKEKMKSLIGRSPDFLDTLIMRMFFEVKPVAHGIRKIRTK